MHIEARLFEFLTAFFVLAAVVYGVLTAMFQYGGIEWAGTTALVLTAGLTLITGTFFRFVARRVFRPDDGRRPGLRVLHRTREALTPTAADHLPTRSQSGHYLFGYPCCEIHRDLVFG